MSRLVWRTYRDPGVGAVPLLRADVSTTVTYIPSPKTPTLEIEFPRHLSAIGLVTRAVLQPGELNTERIAQEPYLLVLQTPVNGQRRQLTRPSGIIQYDHSEQALIVPHASYRGDDSYLSVKGVGLGNGCFKVPRGYPTLRSITVAGGDFTGHVDYDPYHGVVYLESDSGAFPPSNSDVVVGLIRDVTWRIEVKGTEPGRYTVRQGGIHSEAGAVLGMLDITRKTTWSDARRLPVADSDVAAHTVDSAHYDGGPIATGAMWVITTDADPERVEEAVRNTMPLGTLYRIER